VRRPDAQFHANHRPADLVPPGTHPAQVVVVQTPARSYVGPILLTVTISAGAVGVILTFAIAFQMTAAAITAIAAAVPAVGGLGITIKLTRKH
jgi:hypothetical protein